VRGISTDKKIADVAAATINLVSTVSTDTLAVAKVLFAVLAETFARFDIAFACFTDTVTLFAMRPLGAGILVYRGASILAKTHL